MLPMGVAYGQNGDVDLDRNCSSSGNLHIAFARAQEDFWHLQPAGQILLFKGRIYLHQHQTKKTAITEEKDM